MQAGWRAGKPPRGSWLTHRTASRVCKIFQCTHGDNLRILHHGFSWIYPGEGDIVYFQAFADLIRGKPRISGVEQFLQQFEVLQPGLWVFESLITPEISEVERFKGTFPLSGLHRHYCHVTVGRGAHEHRVIQIRYGFEIVA